MAHALIKALSRPSSYSVKKTSFWDDVIDRIEGCLLLADLNDVRAWLDAKEMAFPGAWDESFDERIARKREELEAEDIGQIIRDRYDF